MRFVAGGDAVAEMLLAGALRRSCWQGRCGRDADGEALWRSCCWPWLRGGATAERRCCGGATAERRCCGGVTAERRRRGRDAGGSVAEIHREETAARELHREDAAGSGRLSL